MIIAAVIIIGALILLAMLIGLKHRIGRALRRLMLFLAIAGLLGGGFYVHHKMEDSSSNQPRTSRQTERPQPKQQPRQQNQQKKPGQHKGFDKNKAEGEAKNAGNTVSNKASQAPGKGQSFLHSHWKELLVPAFMVILFLSFITDDQTNQPRR